MLVAGFKNHKATQLGFSLLELMITLVLIGLVSAAIGISVFNPNGPEKNSASAGLNIEQTLRTLALRAINEQHWYAVSVTRESIETITLLDNKWQSVDPAEQILLSDFLSLNLSINQKSIDLSSEELSRIYVSPEGLFSDFELQLIDQQDQSYSITDPYRIRRNTYENKE